MRVCDVCVCVCVCPVLLSGYAVTTDNAKNRSVICYMYLRDGYVCVCIMRS